MKSHSTNPIVEKILELVAERCKTPLTDLKAGKAPITARRAAIYLLKEFDQMGKVIQEALNIHSQPTLYVDLRKFKGEMKSDEKLASLAEEIKAEVLTLSVTEFHSQSENGSSKSEPASKRPSPAPLITLPPLVAPHPVPPSPHPSKEGEIVEMVQTAVSEVCLGPDLLSSIRPSDDIAQARDIAVYLLWKDFSCVSRLPVSLIIEHFHLTEELFFAGIGRVSVRLEEPNCEMGQKVSNARKKYPGGLRK